jgi:HEAT repeats
MHEQLLETLVGSPNEAADDLLLEALRVGTELEQSLILAALFKRQSTRGLAGVVEGYEQFSPRLQAYILANIKRLHHTLRECSRSDRLELRMAAIRLIARAHQGKLAYVLTENMHEGDDELGKAAAEAMVDLARWIADGTRQLHAGLPADPPTGQSAADQSAADQSANGQTTAEAPTDLAALYRDICEQRPEIEATIARALDIHRGKLGQELLPAALLLCDWPQSKVLAILTLSKHGGQNPLVRRLQQAPAAEHVEAFLLGATHGQLRSHFGSVFAHISEPAVLDAILQKTHWLKDHHLQLCMRQVTRGVWWQEGELLHDLVRRNAADACRIGEWLAASGMHDVMQDERFASLAEHCRDDVGGRLRLLRLALQRRKGASVGFLRLLLADRDERLMRMAAREIVRRRPADFENILLQMMTNAPESVRAVISRSIGQVGFDNFWLRFDRLDRPTRKQAGRAMLKILPDATTRLARRLLGGSVEERLKAMQITHELGLVESLRDALTAASNHPHAKVRSKAISVLGGLQTPAVDVLMERVLNDPDSRVRANAIEVLESQPRAQFIPQLAQRAKSGQNRERANAIKALHKMKVGNVGPQLMEMLRDNRPEHRVSGLWAMQKMGLWKLLQEVGRLAKEDQNLRVRRYAVGVLKGVAEMVQQAKGVG